MKRVKSLFLCLPALLLVNAVAAQIGYFDAPYVRYEADLGTLTNATVTARSFAQSNLQSEASGQVCVTMSGAGAAVAWTITAAGSGLVVRYSVPDGQSGALDVFANGALVGTLNLSSYYSWEYLSTNGNPNNTNVVNNNPKMRFDEVRMKLPAQIVAGGTLKLVWKSGTIALDFAELEPIPTAVPAAAGDLIYNGNGSDLQNVISANAGRIIYIPAGFYNIPGELYFDWNNTSLKGAGMWYTELHFTNNSSPGGLRGNAQNVSFSGMYLSTVRNSRSNSYKAINGVFTAGSTISNIWAEHFECGAWIAQFNNTGGPAIADGFQMRYCRFRNNYADGTNLSKGTSNAIVEHCSYRNNGDDDMAIWSANGQECSNNTFRFNTAENSWRASGCAIYGGYSNIAHDLLIKDNLEAGLRVNNSFSGAPFNAGGMHQFYNIRIVCGGTYNDLFNSPVGAIDIVIDNVAGNTVSNVKFSCIEIVDSKNDAIYIKKTSGSTLSNLVFENITVNGTGREYPNNNAGTANGGVRGYGLLFWGSPAGYGTYCNLTYANRGGNAPADVSTANIGSFNWTQAATCPGGCSSLVAATTTITSASTFGECNKPVTFTATTTAPSGSTVSAIEFFVDNVSIGIDNTSAYSMNWNNPAIGNHVVKAVATYSSGATNTATQNIVVAPGIFATPSAPVIDGIIDPLWSNFPSYSLNKVAVGTVSSPLDLSVTFKTTRDAVNLYFLVNVTDDILRNNGVLNWQNDALELLIDMGNKKNTTYGASDFQYNFIYGLPTIYEIQHNAVAGVVLGQTVKASPSGYIMEILIPWATLGGAPAAGSFMGFELGVDDNDNDLGNRDKKIAWTDATDMAYQNPSLFGTLQIAGCPQTGIAPVADFSFVPATACTGQTFTFTDASTNTPTAWAWNFGSGATPATANTQGPHSVVYATAGSKTVSMTASNAAGSNTASKSIVISTTTAQPGVITGNAAPCSKVASTYSIAAVPGATSYTWTLPSGWSGTSSSTIISVTPNNTGGPISVVANNTCGASTVSSLSVTPLVAPAQPGAVSGPASPCSGSVNTYSIAAVAGATSYVWTLPSGWSGTSTGTSISVSSGSAGGTIAVLASNTCGNSAANSLAVAPAGSPAQPGPISGNANPCTGAIITYSIAPVAGASSYTWTLPNGWSGTSTGPSIAVTAGASAGSIDVVAANSCGAAAITSLAVASVGIPNPPAAISGATAPCSGGATSYSIQAVNTATSYAWTFPAGWAGSSSTTSLMVTPNATAGILGVAALNQCGSSASSTLSVAPSSAPAQPGPVSGPTTLCSGNSVSYNITAVSGATSYTWTLPTGWSGSSTGTSIATTAGTAAGNISVVANIACGTSPASAVAVVPDQAPAQPGIITGPTSACSGLAAKYSIAAVTGASSYNWTLPNGWTGTSSSTSITVMPNTTAGNVSVTASNACGTSLVKSIPVSISGSLTVPGTIAGNAAPCSGAASVYSINAVVGAASYTWTLPGGWSGTSSTATLSSMPSTNSGTISVVANNACGTSAASTMAVSPSSSPAPLVAMADKSICAGASTTFDAGNAGASYVWSGQGSGTAQTTTASIAGTYTVTVTNTSNCSAKGSAILLINANPVVSMANQTICTGTASTTFDAGNPGATYAWSGRGTGTGQTIAANTAGTYIVTVKNALGCSSTASALLVVNQIPKPKLGPDTTVCKGQTLTLNPGTAGSFSYSWNPNSETSSTIQVNTSGKYSVQVTDGNGCTGMDSVIVQVKYNCDDFVIEMPSVFTPNGDGLNDIFKPRAENVLSNVRSISFEVFDRWGQLKFASENQLPVWDGTFNGSIVPAGTYFYLVKYQNTGGKDFEIPGFVTLVQ